MAIKSSALIGMDYQSVLQVSLSMVIVGSTLIPSMALANCTISSITGLNFGAYSSFDAAPMDATGQFVFVCTDVQAPVTIRLSSGAANSFTPRQMVLGAARLNYTLTPVNNAPTALNIFGRIPPRQFVPAGNYADTITITIQF